MKPTPLKQVTLTTDGACVPNPGHGGWAAILRFGVASRELSGAAPNTTNNRMEMRAIIEGLRALKEPCSVLVRSDSATALAWCKPTAFKSPQKRVKHSLIWHLVLEFRTVASPHTLTFQWVRGHDGDPDNERCDTLAQDIASRPF